MEANYFIFGRATNLNQLSIKGDSLYWMSVFHIPSAIIKRINQICRSFLWDGLNQVCKLKILIGSWFVTQKCWEDWVSSTFTCPTKPCYLNGGINYFLRIKDLGRRLSLAITTIKQVLQPQWPISIRKCLPFWKNIFTVSKLLFSFTSPTAGNGFQTSFWEEAWATDQCFKTLFPTL